MTGGFDRRCVASAAPRLALDVPHSRPKTGRCSSSGLPARVWPAPVGVGTHSHSHTSLCCSPPRLCFPLQASSPSWPAQATASGGPGSPTRVQHGRRRLLWLLPAVARPPARLPGLLARCNCHHAAQLQHPYLHFNSCFYEKSTLYSPTWLRQTCCHGRGRGLLPPASHLLSPSPLARHAKNQFAACLGAQVQYRVVLVCPARPPACPLRLQHGCNTAAATHRVAVG